MSIFATFTMTDRQDEFGASIFELSWAGTTIEMISGLPGYDPCWPSQDYPRSCRPIPEGIYRVGTPVHESVESCDPAIGPLWIPLEPLSDIGGRDGFLIHFDWNFETSPGTAGCPAPIRHKNMYVIAGAVEAGEFNMLKVDYGYGTV